MSRVVENSAFPSAMEIKLRHIRWRQVGLALVRAVVIAASVLIATMLAAMLADGWFTLFNTGLRTALTVTSLSLAAAVFLLVGIRPVVDALGWTRAARDADAEVPQLEERWTTISHFAKSGTQPATTLSKAMLRQVTSEAVALGALVEPGRVVRAARLRKVLMVAATCAVVLVGFLAVNWEQNSVLLRRFWAPTAAITATQVASATGDAAIPRGQSIDIVTSLSGMGREAATLTLITDADESSTIVLASNSDAPETFTHHVDVDESFRYRVQAGDGRTAWHSITAIDPPKISEVRLKVTAPEYVDRGPYEKTLLPGRVKAIQGSRLTLEMRSDAELERFELLLTRDDESGQPVEQTLALTAVSGGWYRFETLLAQDLSISPLLHSPHGLTNEDRRVCRIRVIPDKAPVARVISPTEEMSVSADEEIDIKFEAHDDHGIAKAELVVYQEFENGEREVLSVQEIPLDDQQLKKHVTGTAKLDLGKFEFDEGTNVSYAVRVTDNRMLNLDPDDVASRRRNGDASADGEAETKEAETKEGEEIDGRDNDATSLAQSTASEESPPAGDPPRTTETASASEGSQSPQAGQESPDETQLANPDAAAGAKEPTVATTEGPTSKDVASNDKGGSRDASDPAADVSESGPEGLRVGAKEQDAAVAKAAVQGEGNTNAETDPASPDDPAAVAAGENDAPTPTPPMPMPTDEPDSTGDKVAASKSDVPLAPDADLRGRADDDTSESPAIAAAAAKMPSEDTAPRDTAARDGDNAKASPAGGSPNLKTPPDGDPRLAQSVTGSPRTPRDDSPPKGPNDPSTDADPKPNEDDPKSPSGSVQSSEIQQSRTATSMPPADLERDMQFESQLGQNTESNRRRLKITDRLAVAAEAGKGRRSGTMNTRELLRRIDKELEAAEITLVPLNERSDSAAMSEKSKQLDARLEKAELIVTDLRNDTMETKYEFVGLQMLDIARTHVTPARDRMFVLIQDPGLKPARNLLEALHHTSSARELIAELTKSFEEVARERELAEALEEVAKIYEVYVENTRSVLREAQPNQNPMRRKMAVVEVDEAYLDRYAEVLEMRRELMAEFARILGDDPRLMGKYMDLIKRRDGNLRNRLTDLRELQEEMTTELGGWVNVDDNVRQDVWIQVAEMRLLAGKVLAKDASRLESRTLSQLPLHLEPSGGIGGQLIQHAREVALKSRQSSLKATKLMSDALENDQAKMDLVTLADELIYELTELNAVLEQLAFENEGVDDVTEFTEKRLAESRSLAEKAIAWAELVSHVRHARYHGLVAVDQQKLAGDTDALRIDMSRIEGDLEGLFRPDNVPTEVTNLVRELMMVLETITFNQAAATYELNNAQLTPAEVQQTMATEGFARAEELFDKMRRTTADILDEREVDDPSIADLEDPTLDEFLERLEREPDLNQLLGMPDRPRNLRVIQDWMLWQAQGDAGAGSAAQQAASNAMQRAKMMARGSANKKSKARQAANDGDLTEAELKKFAEAEDMEQEMATMLRAIEEKIKDPATDAKQRKKLQEKAEMLAQMLEEARGGTLDREKWEELAKGDEMKAMIEALANGEPIPDSQWNRLLSTLDTGLWQVRGRTPPEDYRKAIEQYQDQIRRLLNAEGIDAD